MTLKVTSFDRQSGHQCTESFIRLLTDIHNTKLSLLVWSGSLAVLSLSNICTASPVNRILLAMLNGM